IEFAERPAGSRPHLLVRVHPALACPPQGREVDGEVGALLRAPPPPALAPRPPLGLLDARFEFMDGPSALPGVNHPLHPPVLVLHLARWVDQPPIDLPPLLFLHFPRVVFPGEAPPLVDQGG